MAKKDFRLQLLNRDLCAVDGRECAGVCRKHHYNGGHCTALYHIETFTKRDESVVIREIDGPIPSDD